VCAVLKAQGHLAVDADWGGVNCWVFRATGERVNDRPHPLPPGWRNHYAWHIDRDRVRALAAEVSDGVCFLAGTVENEADAWDLFDHVVCLVIDDETLRYRLATRTTNSFGKDPVELKMAGCEPRRQRALPQLRGHHHRRHAARRCGRPRSPRNRGEVRTS